MAILLSFGFFGCGSSSLPSASTTASSVYVVSTFAGTAQTAGSTNGTGTAASFNHPRGIALDASGNLYVTETTSNTIRKITSAGVVTTFAGTAGSSGSTNATGAAARFNVPVGIAVDIRPEVRVLFMLQTRLII